jgi:hypothetical protein
MTQATVPPPSVIDYNAKPAPRRLAWLNVRVLLFASVFLLIFGVPAYIYLDQTLTGGIKHRADGTLDVDLKTISLFSLDQQSGTLDDVPARFRELDGKKVTLVGEIWAPGAAGNYVGGFDLCYSVAKCCFSGPPQAQHFVKTTPSKPGAPIPYYGGLVRCTGTLKVNVTRDADKITSVYQLSLDEIEPI